MTFKGQGLVTGKLLAVLSLAITPPVEADPLVFQFGGVINFVEEGLPISDLVAIGMPYNAFCEFDPDGVDDTSPLPTIGGYNFGTAGFMSVDIGPLNITTSDLLIMIENSTLLDLFQVGNASRFDAHGTTWLEMELDLRDSTHTAFDSTALPLTAPYLDNFEFSKRFSLLQPNHREPSIAGTVEFLTMVPEPSSVALLVIGAALLSLRRR